MNTLLAVDGSDNSYEAVQALKFFRHDRDGHERKGLTRFVLGSVSHALLHSGGYPVLVYR